jgi:serine phosphatase RsbU (regulator of sigma subunit)
MKNIIYFLFFCLCILLQNALLFSQNTTKDKLNKAIENNAFKSVIDNQPTIDSLLTLINLSKSDTDKIKTYLIICDLCDITDNIKYAEPIITLTDRLLPLNKDSLTQNQLVKWRYKAVDYERFFYQRNNEMLPEEENLYKYHMQIAAKYRHYESYTDAANALSNFYFKQGNMLKKLNILLEGYETNKKANYYKGVSRMLIQTAFFYADNKDTASAIDYINKAIENEKLIKDDKRKNRGFIIRGNLYRDLGQYEKALNEYKGAIQGYTNAKDTSALADAYRQIAYLYQNKKEYEKAIENFKRCEQIAQSNNDFGLLVQVLIGKGDALASLGKYEEAIKEHKWLWDKISSHLNETDKTTIVFFGSHLAKDYVLAQRYQEAKKILDLLTPITSVAVEISNIENLAFRADSALGNYKEALIHYQHYIKIQQKLQDIEISKAGAQQKFKNDLEKQKNEQAQKDAQAQAENKRQKLLLTLGSVVLILVVIFTAFVFRNLKTSQKQNKIIASQKQEVEIQKHLVDEKQKEIVDSITYAKRLQEAILPPTQFISQNFPNNFILYKPKDIVAGDFYWSEKIGDLFFIAAADCTGHGVPGAMVSVVCSNALNRSVKEFGLTETGKILDKTRELVIETFEKSHTEVKDGMDISLLCIDTQNQKVFWSGANNPLWYVHDTIFEVIKADKLPVGKSYDTKPFTTNELDYKPGTTFYLFTDGLADQFGGEKGKKFKYKQFEELLISINHKTMQEQSDIISQKFENWRGALEQVDDICVIGIKI